MHAEERQLNQSEQERTLLPYFQSNPTMARTAALVPNQPNDGPDRGGRIGPALVSNEPNGRGSRRVGDSRGGPTRLDEPIEPGGGWAGRDRHRLGRSVHSNRIDEEPPGRRLCLLEVRTPRPDVNRRWRIGSPGRDRWPTPTTS